LAEIPQKFGLPLVLQPVPRLKKSGNEKQQELVQAHSVAMVLCTLDIENWMRSQEREICQLVVEDNDHARNSIALLNAAICKPNIKDELNFDIGLVSHLLPLQRIRKSVLFEPKSSPSVLEVVDFCLYVTRKIYRQENAAIFQPLLNAFWGQRVFAIR
jgi:hypothetical protein